LANTLYARDFAKSTDLAVATTLLANLGLASQAGLDAWVAAQLTAAGAANKGAKIVSLLNDFAGLASDATWGTYATAFNTKVDAALAASQKTGSVEAKFEAAGTVASTAATFTLTTGVDTGAAFTGSAGNDTFNATVATLGALDVIDAGLGSDILSVVETNSITTWGGASLTGFEIAKVSSTGAIGSIASAATSTPNKAAVAQVVDFTLGTPTDANQTYDVTIGGNKYTTGAVGGSAAAGDAWTAIKAVLSAHLADDVNFDDTYYQVSSKIAGSPLPSIAIALNTTGTGTASISATTATNGSVANVIGTAPVAIPETKTVTVGGTVTVAEVFTLSVGGADYTFSAAAATTTAAGDAVATTLNTILGAGSATNAAGVVTVKALTAGTPLPLMNLTTSASATTVITAGIANKAANAVASSAAALAAPTGVTSYTATATGVANVSGAATTDITASGTAVQTSVGKDVTVTASDSVFVSGAKGVSYYCNRRN